MLHHPMFNRSEVIGNIHTNEQTGLVEIPTSLRYVTLRLWRTTTRGGSKGEEATPQSKDRPPLARQMKFLVNVVEPLGWKFTIISWFYVKNCICAYDRQNFSRDPWPPLPPIVEMLEPPLTTTPIGRVSYIRISLCYFCFRWKTVSLVQASMQHLMHRVTVSLQQFKITLQSNCINNTSITQPTLSFYLWLKMYNMQLSRKLLWLEPHCSTPEVHQISSKAG